VRAFWLKEEKHLLVYYTERKYADAVGWFLGLAISNAEI